MSTGLLNTWSLQHRVHRAPTVRGDKKRASGIQLEVMVQLEDSGIHRPKALTLATVVAGIRGASGSKDEALHPAPEAAAKLPLGNDVLEVNIVLSFIEQPTQNQN